MHFRFFKKREASAEPKSKGRIPETGLEPPPRAKRPSVRLAGQVDIKTSSAAGDRQVG